MRSFSVALRCLYLCVCFSRPHKASMGIKLEWERVLEIAGEAAPGRPHVAQALVEGGFVSNFREAFSRYLHNDGPAYVEV